MHSDFNNPASQKIKLDREIYSLKCFLLLSYIAQLSIHIYDKLRL